MPKPLPVVFDYGDLRAFLRDSYLARKARDRRFSYGRFARQAGIASRGHLRDMLSGRRGLTPDFAKRIARALGLGEEERECFLLLADVGQAQDAKGRQAAQAALHRWLHLNRRRELSHAEATELRSAWHHLVVLGLTRHPAFRPDPRWVFRALQGRVTLAEARSSLSLLSRLSLIRTRGGKLLWTAAGSLRGRGVASHAPSGGAIVRLHELATEAARKGTDHGGTFFSLAILTRAEAAEALDAFRRALGEAVARRERPPASGELCVLMSDVFAISSCRASGIPSTSSGQALPLS